MTVVLAHIGHWYLQLLFVAPVALLVGVLSFQGWRENRTREKAIAKGSVESRRGDHGRGRRDRT